MAIIVIKDLPFLIVCIGIVIKVSVAPLPNRLERSVEPTLGRFYDEINTLFRQCSLFMERHVYDGSGRPNADGAHGEHSSASPGLSHRRHSDYVETELQHFITRFQMALRHIQSIRPTIVPGDHIHAEELHHLEHEMLCLVTNLQRHTDSFLGRRVPAASGMAGPVNNSQTQRGTRSVPRFAGERDESTGRPTICPRTNINHQRGASSYEVTHDQLETLLGSRVSVSEIARKKLLGMGSRTTVYRAMRRHNIPTRRDRMTPISQDDLESEVADINRRHPNSGSEEVRRLYKMVR